MLITGTGGHAKECFAVLSGLGLTTDLCFYNDLDPHFQFAGEELGRYTIIRSADALEALFSADPRFVLGTGNPAHRHKLFETMVSRGGKPYDLVAAGASVDRSLNELGAGLNIMSGAAVNIHNRIGTGALINTHAVVTHDCMIGSFAELGPGCILGGNCSIGDHAFIGMGACILPGIRVGESAVVAAGAVVTRDVPPFTMAAGNPAVIKKVLPK